MRMPPQRYAHASQHAWALRPESNRVFLFDVTAHLKKADWSENAVDDHSRSDAPDGVQRRRASAVCRRAAVAGRRLGYDV